MKKLSFKEIDKTIKQTSIEHFVIRLLMAWCSISILQTVYVKLVAYQAINYLNFQAYVSFGWNVVEILCAFLLFSFLFSRIRNQTIENITFLILTFFYSIICIVSYQNLIFCIGMVGLMTASVCYCLDGIDTSKIQVPTSVLKTIAIIAMIGFVAFAGGCTALRYLTYSAPNFDLGLFSQMFHYMKTTLTMNTTSERDMLLSHLKVHVSPDFYLLLPFYALISSPATLEVMQAVLIALGIIPLILICRNHKLSQFETIAVIICYAAYPAMSGGCFYDIHENAFLPLFLLCFLYFMEKDSTRGMIISMILVLGVKEDAAIYMALIALYMILGRNQKKKGGIVFICACLYFVFTTVYLGATGEGVMSYRFNNMIYGGNGNMLGIVETIISNPAYLITQMFEKEKLEFMAQTLLPLFMMPFITKKWSRFILFGPYILFNLMSDYTYFHSIFFQYAFGSTTLLVYLAVINVADLKTQWRSKAIPMMAISSVLFFSCIMLPKLEIVETYNNSYNQKIYAVFEEAFQTIPDNASVTATTFLCPALSERDELYELYYTDKTTEYVVLDLRKATTDYSVDDYLNNDNYETVYYEPYVIGVFRNKTYAIDND